MNLLIRILQSVLNFLTWAADLFTTRRISDAEARLKKQVARLKASKAKADKEHEDQIAELTAKNIESEQARRKTLVEYGEITRERDSLQEQLDEVRLTLEERQRYILEVEQASQGKDTEIGLQRMEIEELTLWREKQLQLLRTEADIEAAKSKVLQGRNADRTLENLKNVDNKKNDG